MTVRHSSRAARAGTRAVAGLALLILTTACSSDSGPVIGFTGEDGTDSIVVLLCSDQSLEELDLVFLEPSESMEPSPADQGDSTSGPSYELPTPSVQAGEPQVIPLTDAASSQLSRAASDGYDVRVRYRLEGSSSWAAGFVLAPDLPWPAYPEVAVADEGRIEAGRLNSSRC